MKVAKSAYKTGDYETAVRHWGKLADHGYPEAQFRLGKCYLKGEGVEEDPEKAYALFKRAAKDEEIKARAFFELGRIHEKGEGAKQSGPLAERYYREALKRHYDKAAYYLAQLYRKGKLVDKNLRKAIPLYIWSSRTGNPRAAYQLGNLYNEQGNDQKAVYWYKRAYNGGTEKAAFKLGRLFAKEKDNPDRNVLALAWYYIGKKAGDEKAKQAAESLEGRLTSDMIEKASGFAASSKFMAE